MARNGGSAQQPRCVNISSLNASGMKLEQSANRCMKWSSGSMSLSDGKMMERDVEPDAKWIFSSRTLPSPVEKLRICSVIDLNSSSLQSEHIPSVILKMMGGKLSAF